MKKITSLIALAVMAVALPVSASIIAPGDDVIGGQLDGAGNFVEGVTGTAGETNNWPGGEAPEFAIDGTNQKYLNFGEQNTGIIVTPSGGESVLNKIKVWTANDAVPRDPTAYQIWGSNDPAVHAGFASGTISLASFTLVNSGPLNLPDTGPSMSRNPGGTDKDIEDAIYYTATTFDNTQAFCTYAIVFDDVKDAGAANSMQLAEVQVHGDFTGVNCVPEPTSAILFGLSLLALPVIRRRK